MSYLTVNSGKEQCQNKHQTRYRSLILIISTSFGEWLFSGDRVCIWRETMLKWSQQYNLEHATWAWELESPHLEANQLKPKRKHTSDKSEADTRIQGPNDIPNQHNFRGTQRSNTRTHLSVVQRKEGPRGAHSGSADPLGRPNHYWAQWGPSFSCK